MDDLFIVFVVLLTLLTLISALGGSIYDAESFAAPTYVSGKTKMSKHHAAGGMRTGKELYEDPDPIAVPMADTMTMPDDYNPTMPPDDSVDAMPIETMMNADPMPDVTMPPMEENWEEDAAYMAETMPDAMPDIMPDDMPEMPDMPNYGEDDEYAMDMPTMPPTEDFVVEGFDGDMYAAF